MTIPFVTLAEVPEREAAWFWPNYIPACGVTVMSGLPECGKSMVLCDLIARATRGDALPHTEQGATPRAALYLAAEDSAFSLKKRFQQAGADLRRVHLLETRAGQPLWFPESLSDLRETVRKLEAKLVVIDPLASFISMSLASDSFVRPLMDGFNCLSMEMGVAIVLVRHWTKSGTSPAIYRGAGGTAITAAARSELINVKRSDPEEPLVLAQVKNNLAPRAKSLAFCITDGASGSQVQWLGESAYSAEELIASQRDRPAIEEAKRMLFTWLGDGPLWVKDVQVLAGEHGIARATLRRAKEELGIESERSQFGRGGKFYWVLPTSDQPVVRKLWDREIEDLSHKLFYGEEARHNSGNPSLSPEKRRSTGPDEEGNTTFRP
jgi:hypothetical protein